jgi:indolepyruvate ferredoxin oxidoreductase beta subunit
MPSERPIKLTIAALGGEGGGVLASWLVEIAESEGYLAQTTSVPGVAQRTGATLYYLEFFPRKVAAEVGHDPIMALMPVPGDVDLVLASELAEAARAIQRGLVTRDRTTLIASAHRAYTINEKSAMGDGTADETQLLALVRMQSKRSVVFDMEAVAERHHSVISSVMLGALGGSSVLPFRKAAFEAAIKRGGIAIDTNMAAFEDAYQRAEQGGEEATGPDAANPGYVPEKACSPAMQPLLDRLRRLPESVRKTVLEGVRRTIDYQDPKYASSYLDRVERMAALDAQLVARAGHGSRSGGSEAGSGADATSDTREGAGSGYGPFSLTEATARSLALWMTFEDTIRVADLKTRPERFERVREEIRAEPGQLFGITEFMKPRVEEIAGTLPAGVGRWVLRSPWMSHWISRWTGGKRIRTGTVSGFLLLHTLAGLKRWRRGTLRYQEETSRIERWLGQVEGLADTNYALAVELARAQRLVKGYGDTHERGWRNFSSLVDRITELAPRPDGAAIFARLHAAALADEEGKALARELAEISGVAVVKAALERARA